MCPKTPPTLTDKIPSYIRKASVGVRLYLLVQPKSSREGPTGVTGTEKVELRWAVHAPAADGKANASLKASLASFFSVRKSDIKIVSGETSRHKQIEVAGLGVEAAIKKLARERL